MNQQNPNGAGSIAQPVDVKKSKNPKRALKLFALLIIFIGLIAGGYLGYKYYKSSQKSNTPMGTSEAKYIKDMLGSDSKVATKEYLVEKYSQAYGVSLHNTSNTNPVNWDKAKVDDAYTTLLYVNKMGSFAQTLQYLALLERAKVGGVDIDNNSYGIDQKTRDEIYKTAMQESAKALEQKETGN